MFTLARRIVGKLKRIFLNFHEYRYVVHMSGYKINGTKKVIDRLHPMIVKYAKKRFRQGNGNLLNELFFVSFFVKAQKEPDEKSYNKWIHDFATMAFKSGETYRQPTKKWHNGKKKLAFIGLGDDPSAYIHVYHLCEYFQKLGNFEPYLFLFSPHDNLERVRAQFNEVDTLTVQVPFNESTILESSEIMRESLEAHKIDIAVWVHLPTLMFPLFGMGIAEKQVFFCQYLHPDLKKFPIDGLITYGNISEKESVFLHDPWRVIPSSLTIPTNQIKVDPILRESFSKDEHTIILGTFGRIEKIRQTDFLEAVAQILRQTENTVYLYTGYENDPQIGLFFNERGLSERVKFIGWVDIDAYVPIVDIILDSFPLATGVTALKAMAYGKPVLSLANMYSYMGRDIKPLINNANFLGYEEAHPLFDQLKEIVSKLPFQPYADTKDDYIAKAISLVQDEHTRKQFSDFQIFCSENLYKNNDLMGAIFTRHLQDIFAMKQK